jgi:D-alanine transaminase
METTYFNGKFIGKDDVRISPDDRGFLFADGIYEVIRWYRGFFYDMDNHLIRLKRSMRELKINWPDADLFPGIATELIKVNNLSDKHAMVYLQVTRGASRRSHSFPSPEVTPTVYAYAWGFTPDIKSAESGIKVMLKEDIRWSRCDIKSVALLPNTLSFQEACEKELKECIFMRNGLITEGSHSNIFFVKDSTLFTHPESNNILSGVTRKNILRIARESGISIMEEAIPENMLKFVQESFISNTSSEVMPVVEIGGTTVGEGIPGPVTKLIREKFDKETLTFKE